MADQQHGPPGLVVRLDLAVDLGDQRAGGVGEQQPAAPRLGRHRLGHAVRREHHQPVLGHLVQLLDEHRAQAAQLVDHVAVVDDLVADIDRRAVLAQGLLDHVDRALDPGAETARAGEEDLERREGGRQGRRLSAASDRAVPNTKVAARRERAAWSSTEGGPRRVQQRRAEAVVRMMSGSRGHRGRGTRSAAVQLLPYRADVAFVRRSVSGASPKPRLGSWPIALSRSISVLVICRFGRRRLPTMSV